MNCCDKGKQFIQNDTEYVLDHVQKNEDGSYTNKLKGKKGIGITISTGMEESEFSIIAYCPWCGKECKQP